MSLPWMRRWVAAAIVIAAATGWAGADLTLSQDATQIGANTFYANGYTGTRSIVGVVDSGMAWTGHDALHAVIDQTDPFAPAGGVAAHATAVSGVIAAASIPTGGPGIAYGATTWSTGISTGDAGGGSFFISGDSLAWALMTFGQVGINGAKVVGGEGSRTANVISTSWTDTDDTGDAVENKFYDYLAVGRGVTMVCAAGNFGQGEGKVPSPANGWNVIAVGGTTGSGASEAVWSGSSGGKVGSFSDPGTRTKPDIVAPAVGIVMPVYNADPSQFGAGTGTSFAAPAVAAGAALLIDAGLATNRGTDPRVVKAVLMNSATKLPGWSQVTGVSLTKGTVINSTPVDSYQGTGRLNLTQAWSQYTASSGETGNAPGLVGGTGWSLNTVGQNAPVDYVMNNGINVGDKVTATLIWFMDRTVSGYDSNSNDPYPAMTFSNDKFDDLDLYLYKVDVNGDAQGNAVAASISGWDVTNPDAPGTGWDSVEHINFAVPEDGRYMLEVVWTQRLGGVGPNEDEFALAWTETPEPGTVMLIGMGVAILVRRRRQRVRS